MVTINTQTCNTLVHYMKGYAKQRGSLPFRAEKSFVRSYRSERNTKIYLLFSISKILKLDEGECCLPKVTGEECMGVEQFNKWVRR